MPEQARKNDLPLVNDIAGFLPFENDLLVRSELLIEKQREHIKDLKERLRDQDKARQADFGEKTQELRILQESNAKLRLEIDLLRGELNVKEETIHLAETTNRQWKDEITQLTQKLADAETKLQEHTINITTKTATQNNSANAGSTARTRLGDDSESSADRLHELKLQIVDAENLLLSLRNKIDETRISVSCMADAEYELVECREIIRDQKNKLACLQRLVDAAAKEKQIIPPTLLIDSKAFGDRKSLILKDTSDDTLGPIVPNPVDRSDIQNLQNMLQTLSAKFQADDTTASVTMHLLTVFKDLQDTIKDKLAHEPRGQVAEIGGDFVSLAVSHLKLMVSPSEIPATTGPDLLNFAHDYVERTKRLSESLFHERVITIGTKFFSISEEAGGKLILHKFHQWDCKAMWDELDAWVVLRCLPAGDPKAAECHILNFGGPDQYLRGFHALQYAGVIPAGQHPLEFLDLEKTKGQFTAVLGDPKNISDGVTTMPCLTFKADAASLKISGPSDNVLSVLNPADCIVQCDSQNQCVKVWVPEPEARKLFGASPSEDASGLTQVNCVFTDPSNGYSKFLSEISPLRWKDVILSSEAKPAIIDKMLHQSAAPPVARSPPPTRSPPIVAKSPPPPTTPPTPQSPPPSTAVLTPTQAPASTSPPPPPPPIPVAPALREVAPAIPTPPTVSPGPVVAKQTVNSPEPIAPKSPSLLAKADHEGSSHESLQDLQDTLGNLNDEDFEQLIIEPGVLKIMADKTHVLCELKATDYQVRFHDGNAEIDILRLDPNTSKILDQYTFKFPERTAYEAKRTALLTSGFRETSVIPDQSRDSKADVDSNIAVVRTQQLKLRGVEIDAKRADVTMNPKRREINITEHLPNGKTRKVRLDCTPSQYKNWLRALTWAEFRMNGKPPLKSRAGMKLKEFRFVIHAANQGRSVDNLIRMTQSGELSIFADGDKEPKFTLTKVNSEIMVDASTRLLRCKVNPRSPHELWLEISFPILKDLDDIEASLRKSGLIKGCKSKFVLGEFADQKMPVISMRRGLFQMWMSANDFNSDKKPTLTLSSSLVNASSVKNGDIMFVPKGVVDKNMADQRRVLSGFFLELSGHPEEYEALRFGLIHSEFWMVSNGMTPEERAYQPYVAITTIFHGTGSYTIEKKKETLGSSRWNTAAMAKISDACVMARQYELNKMAKKAKAVVSKIKAGSPSAKSGVKNNAISSTAVAKSKPKAPLKSKTS